VTIAADRIARFAQRFNDVARARLSREDLVPELRIDLELPIEEVTEDLEGMLRHFEPHGMGNAAPMLAARDVVLAAPPRRVGEDGVRLKLRRGDGELDAIGWGLAARAEGLSAGTRVDVAFRLERDEFRGQSRLQARLADVVPARGMPLALRGG
jgi:single-stranded-DNA-specific exonuclease